MADRHDNRSSDEIRRDIEGTRSDLHETVDALERKLSVGQIVDEVWGRVAGGRSMGSAASSVGDTIREYPVPLALMGLGVAWLAIEKATGSSSSSDRDFDRGFDRYDRYGVGSYERAEGRVGPYGGESARSASEEQEGSTMDRAKSKATDAAAVMKQKVSNAAEAAKGRASEVGDRFRSSGEDEGSDSGTSVRDRAGDMASRARHGVEHGTQRARRGFWKALEEQPLALGAVAFGLGLAGGLSAPTTRWEDEHMGRASDSVKREAGHFVEEKAEDAGEVARAAAHAAKEEGQRKAEEVQDKHAESSTGEQDVGLDPTGERGIEPESMKKPPRRSGTRARDRATE